MVVVVELLRAHAVEEGGEVSPEGRVDFVLVLQEQKKGLTGRAYRLVQLGCHQGDEVLFKAAFPGGQLYHYCLKVSGNL